MKKFSILITVAACLLLAGCNGNKGYDYPFQNPKLSVDKRVDNLISLLTLEEKVRLMEHESPAIDRLGIPQNVGCSTLITRGRPPHRVPVLESQACRASKGRTASSRELNYPPGIYRCQRD